MGIYLFLLFIVVPVVEIFLITQVASQLSWLPTIALVVGVSMIGAWLVRREGSSVFTRVRTALNSGKLPTDELADGAMIFFASALMLTPGFLTDFFGLALLIPPIRALMRPPVIAFFKKRLEVRTGGITGAMFNGAQTKQPRPGEWPGSRPATGRDVYDASARPAPADADITDITKESPGLSDGEWPHQVMSSSAGHRLVLTDAFVRDLHDQLAAATDRIYIQVMTFDGDESGLGVADKLVAAAERGVDVQLAVDSFAFRYISDVTVSKERNRPEVAEEEAATLAMFDRMEQAGVEISYVNPFGRLLQWGPIRNHKKMYVIDELAYLGGINISDHNFGWLDFNVTIEAPELIEILVDDFAMTRAGEKRALNGPIVTNEFIESTVADLMQEAEESIVIASPYALDATLARRLATVKAPRKVIVAPERNNYRTFRVSDPYVRAKMEAAGVEQRAFTDFFHAKFAVFDSRRVFIGSTNFGLHSFRCNQEIGMVIDDEALAAEFEEMLERTVAVPTSTTSASYAVGAFVSWYIRTGTLFFGKVVSPYAPTLTTR